MTSDVSIGEFSRLCHLGAKTLRYYHDIELLVPDAVDAGTGYRRYSVGQVADAHLIRRLRDLDMPLAEIRQVLGEPDQAARERALARHLDRMEAELTRTRDVVVSLRRLLGAPPQVPVGHRQSPVSTVLRMSARLARTQVSEWFGQAYPRLYGTLAGHGLDPAGAAGATYSAEFFEQDEGEVVAFVPVLPESAPPGDDRFTVLPRQRFAVALHTGPFSDCDLTYGWLGAHVAAHDIALADPIVEVYLVGPDHTNDPNQFQTEICWPIH
ncbi:MerR family transcriptional regulator [Acrocarpospora pleiomorpha]|nr:MerR family transcriptional regulator [Acrocarpospora pleiomorpha]